MFADHSLVDRGKIHRINYSLLKNIHVGVRKIFLLSVLCSLLGCANCVNLKVLRPQVKDATRFEAFYNEASGNEVFLRSEDFSIWLKPCSDGRSISQGTICATLFVSGTHELRFSSDLATFIDNDDKGAGRLRLVSAEFGFDQALKGGNSEASSSNPFAYAPHRQSGAKWNFTINGVSDFNEKSLRLPALMVDGKAIEIPEIHFSPVFAQQCFTFH